MFFYQNSTRKKSLNVKFTSHEQHSFAKIIIGRKSHEKSSIGLKKNVLESNLSFSYTTEMRKYSSF